MTPGSSRTSSCTPQKHPPARIAVSVGMDGSVHSLQRLRHRNGGILVRRRTLRILLKRAGSASDRSRTMTEIAATDRATRIDLGPLVGRGFNCEVYANGDGRVVKVFESSFPAPKI